MSKEYSISKIKILPVLIGLKKVLKEKLNGKYAH